METSGGRGTWKSLNFHLHIQLFHENSRPSEEVLETESSLIDGNYFQCVGAVDKQTYKLRRKQKSSNIRKLKVKSFGKLFLVVKYFKNGFDALEKF